MIYVENQRFCIMVRKRGLEPPRLVAPDPKSGASANFAISAKARAKLYFKKLKVT